MEYKIHANWEVNSYLKNHISKQCNRLEKYKAPVNRIDIFLKDHPKDLPKKEEVELRVRITGSELFASAHAESFEKATTECFEKIEKQLIKRKEILSQR